MDQGFFGALEQYWTVEPKPRLNRRNTFFEDHTTFHNNWTILNLVLVAMTVCFLVLIFWSIRWVIV